MTCFNYHSLAPESSLPPFSGIAKSNACNKAILIVQEGCLGPASCSDKQLLKGRGRGKRGGRGKGGSLIKLDGQPLAVALMAYLKNAPVLQV